MHSPDPAIMGLLPAFGIMALIFVMVLPGLLIKSSKPTTTEEQCAAIREINVDDLLELDTVSERFGEHF